MPNKTWHKALDMFHHKRSPDRDKITENTFSNNITIDAIILQPVPKVGLMVSN